jgi:D-lactate dehydrogenase (cytochrome)
MRTPVNATTLFERLAGTMGSRVTRARSVLEQHGRSEAYHECLPPDLVAFPESTDEVVEIVRLCADMQVPIVPFGAGTSLEGSTAAIAGGLSIDFSRMNKVLAVHATDMDVVVQPGITRKQLNAQLRDTGLFFPIDPGADASIGGMTSTRASGTMAVRYGTMKDNVMALEVVLADGRVIRTGKRARKSAAGYDLTRLFVGAEGTLGIIAEVTLRLHPVPQAISAAVCSFDSLDDAVNSAIEVIQSAIPVARVELVDEVMMRGINAYSKLGYREAPTLFLEFHGSDSAVAEQAQAAQAIALDHGGGGFEWAREAEQRSRLWRSATWRSGPHYRRLRADLAPCGMPGRDPARCRRERLDRTHRGSCRRREFPHACPARPLQAGGGRKGQGTARANGRPIHFHGRNVDR